MNLKNLQQCPLFKNIQEQELLRILKQVKAFEKTYEKGSFIYHTGDHARYAGIVLSGSVAVVQRDVMGNENIFNLFRVGDIFAETYACLQDEVLMVDVIAKSEATILLIDLTRLWNDATLNTQLFMNLNALLAHKNLYLSMKITHVTPRTIRMRLLSYLKDESIKQNSLNIALPYNRQQLADYLCVDRSALSNEISKLNKEGIVKAKKGNIQLNIK